MIAVYKVVTVVNNKELVTSWQLCRTTWQSHSFPKLMFATTTTLCQPWAYAKSLS